MKRREYLTVLKKPFSHIKKLRLPIVIVFSGILVASSIFIFSRINNAQEVMASSPQWTEETGGGLSVPACGSTYTNVTGPTCVNAGDTVTYQLSWALDGTDYCHWQSGVPWVYLEENSVVLNNPIYGAYGDAFFQCGDTLSVSGRQPNTDYTYRLNYPLPSPVNLNPAPINTPICLAVSCSVSPPSITTGGSATWTATPSGGDGSYGYSWLGTDGLSGNTQSVTKIYSSPGTKSGSVTVTSGTQTITQACSNSLTVNTPPTCNISASPNPVPWNTGTTLTWSSTDATSCTTNTLSWGVPIGTPVPTANVQPTGNFDTSTALGLNCTGPGGSTSCSTTVQVTPFCTASPSSVVIGQSTNLTAGGGDGTYSWFIPGGTPASGSGSPISTSYSTTGTKTVTVTSAGQNRTCEVNVTSTPVPGCTDPAATNYNPSATVDDGSCTYPSTYTLTVNSSGASNVIITGSPSTYGGTTNPTSYTKISIPSGTGITLTAPLTSGGNNFANWSGCDTTSGTNCTVTMIANKTVTATYTPPTSETLKVKRANMDSSFFVAQPTSAWVDNIGPDTVNLSTFTVSAGGHTVYASKVVGYTIVDAGFCDGLNCGVAAFSLPLTCDASRCSVFVTVNQGIQKKVVFRYDVTSVTTYTVTASINSGSGTITGPGISCPGDCSEIYPSGTWITVIATPSAGYSFTSWASGAGSICAGQGSTCSALIDGNKTVGANFSSSVPFDYSLSNSGTSNVTKTSGDAFTQNTITKTLTSGKPQTVTLSLSGEPAGVTHSFSGGGTCSPPCTSVITFTVAPITLVGTYPITVTGTSAGTPNKTTIFDLVVLASSGGSMSVSCSASAPTALIGESVTWTAVVSGGTSPFTYSWSGTNIPTNPSPNTNPFSISYSTIGQKIAIVTVTDANSVVARCDGGAGGGSGGNAGTIYINFDPSFREF